MLTTVRTAKRIIAAIAITLTLLLKDAELVKSMDYSKDKEAAIMCQNMYVNVDTMEMMKSLLCSAVNLWMILGEKYCD